MIEQEKRPGFDRRMTREEINALPMRHYEGRVEVVRSREQLQAAVEKLGREKVLGFDTETRPSFRKGESYPPSLVQLTGRTRTYLFQLRQLKFPRPLRRILADPGIIKAGVALRYDIEQLKEVTPFEAAGLVDLGEVAKKVGIKNHGLRGLAAVLLGFRISKSAQVSNWARTDLLPTQVQYAATDSWVSRELYLKFKELGADLTPMNDGAGGGGR